MIGLLYKCYTCQKFKPLVAGDIECKEIRRANDAKLAAGLLLLIAAFGLAQIVAGWVW